MLDCRLELITSSLHTDCLRQAAPEGAPGSCTFPPTVNDAGAWELAKQAARELTTVEDVIESQPTMGGEVRPTIEGVCLPLVCPLGGLAFSLLNRD